MPGLTAFGRAAEVTKHSIMDLVKTISKLNFDSRYSRCLFWGNYIVGGEALLDEDFRGESHSGLLLYGERRSLPQSIGSMFMTDSFAIN